MDAELEDTLFSMYPTVFDQVHDFRTSENTNTEHEERDPPSSVALYGIQCDNGWFTIINSLCDTLENRVNPTLENPMEITQVKEKFGGLRVYATRVPEEAQASISTARLIASNTCEVCGDTPATKQTVRGRIKTVCDACYLESVSIDHVNVWEFKKECFNCNSSVSVLYPEPLGSDSGGTWTSVGAQLAELSGSHVQRVFSSQQQSYVWGNICPECDAYIGNYFVYRTFSKERTQTTKRDEIPLHTIIHQDNTQ